MFATVIWYNQTGDTMAQERIDKLLAAQTANSRSDIKKMIKTGRVQANGQTVRRPEEKYDPDTVQLTIDGRSVLIQKHVYLMMNKPAGVLSASRDSRARTVIDLLPEEWRHRELFPAGRLDKDTEGLLLLTDDGELAHKMLAPKSHVYKRYIARCDRPLTEQDVEAFAQGIVCGELAFLPAELRLLDKNCAAVEICEGKFHQIKRMFHAVGAEVIALKRIRIGGVTLDENLTPGQVRPLTKSEIAALLDRNHGIENDFSYALCTNTAL